MISVGSCKIRFPCLPSYFLLSALRRKTFSDGLKFTGFTTCVAVMGNIVSLRFLTSSGLLTLSHSYSVVSLIAGIPCIKFTNGFEHSAYKAASKQSQVAARWKKLNRSLLLVFSFTRQPPSTKSKFRGCCADLFSFAEVRDAFAFLVPLQTVNALFFSKISFSRVSIYGLFTPVFKSKNHPP
jgi:hypothetical protein